MTRLARGLALLILATGAAIGLAACDDAAKRAAVPSPREPGPEAVGYYCGMTVADHAGPKGQILLEGREEPLWFSSARDALAFTRLPEESKAIAAIYVTDMAVARDWEQPEAGSWVEAREAVFVVGSERRGGMGALETVPFSDRAAAERFQEEHGGRLFSFENVPESAVLGPDTAAEQPGGGHDGHDSAH